MAIGRDTLRRLRELRQRINDLLDQRARQLTRDWTTEWDRVAFDVLDAVLDLIDSNSGEWPASLTIARHGPLTRALRKAREALDKLVAQAVDNIASDTAEAASIGAGGQPDIIASQFPPQAGERGQLAVSFDRVDTNAVQAIVDRTREKITSTAQPLSGDAEWAMRRELIRGVIVGTNPREAARRMLQRVEGAFNGGLTRALVISRTETLDAHRAGARAQQDANEDVLAGWMWNAHLDTRTCPACWSLHGTVWPLDEPGPLDHQQGRCSRTPKTKGWEELGFTGIQEPPDLTEDAETVFRNLPQGDQLAIMGQARLDALNSGQVAWRDLAVRRSNSGWRDSYTPRPVRDLQ